MLTQGRPYESAAYQNALFGMSGRTKQKTEAMNQNKRKSVLCIRIDPDEMRTMDTIAKTKGCQRSEWIRGVLSAAVLAECRSIVSASASEEVKA